MHGGGPKAASTLSAARNLLHRLADGMP